MGVFSENVAIISSFYQKGKGSGAQIDHIITINEAFLEETLIEIERKVIVSLYLFT